MKKSLFVLTMLSVLLFSSCSKDDDKDNPKTTYEIINNSSKSDNSVAELDGSMYEVTVFCFIGDDVVREDNIDVIKVNGGRSSIIEVPDNFEKIKVSFKFLPKSSIYYNMSSNYRKYTVSYTILQKGKNNTIILSDETMLGNTLKSTFSNLEENNNWTDLSSELNNVLFNIEK